jgi:pantetheine-phosphate adenylyltransferase
MSERRIGLYPGTFDPATRGHLDIIGRASKLVDTLVIGVAANAGKGPLFSLDERVALLQTEIEPIARRNGSVIEVRPFDCLLIQFARRIGARVIIRGLRAVSDFEYEFQMAGMNARLDPGIETVFLMASEGVHFISSRFVKEIALLGGDITPFVSTPVIARIAAKVAERGEAARLASGSGSAHD